MSSDMAKELSTKGWYSTVTLSRGGQAGAPRGWCTYFKSQRRLLH